MPPSPAPSPRLFAWFCAGSFLLSMAYGTTFLLALLVASRGGSEADAGVVISVAMLSTFVAVIFSGHLMDAIGATRAMAASGVLLALACLGFSLTPALGMPLLACGLVLGLGWGAFYTLGPIVIATMVEPAHRARYFAILSGSMMSGIGSGPLIGRAVTHYGCAVEQAFAIAAAASLLGALVYWRLNARIASGPNHLGAVSAHRLTWSACKAVLRSNAVFPIIMVGLGACIFGGLSSFQTSYASLRKLDYSLFFLGFMCAAISCRLFIASFVVRRDPYVTSCVLSALTVISMLQFLLLVSTPLAYLSAAVVLGVGYGLTYSVINGLVTQEAPRGLTAQGLLLFSLAYFLGVFGFPWVAGKIIVHAGMQTFLLTLVGVALLNWGITVTRLVARRRTLSARAVDGRKA